MITTALPQPTTQLVDGMWTASIDHVMSKWHAHPEDERKPRSQRPLTEQSRRWLQVLGATADEVKVYVVRERRTTPDMYGYESIERGVRLVSAKPFVVVKVVDPDEYYDYTRYGFVAAQEVHNGQPGRKPQLTMEPSVVKSDMRDPGAKPDENGLVKRRLNWVRLSDLSVITGLGAADIIRSYAPFSPSTVYESNVPLARGDRSRVEWSYDPSIIRVYTGSELPQGYCIAESNWGGDNTTLLDTYAADKEWNPHELWVPQTFANRVIRLAGFGYRPGQPLPEASCQIAAPMPAQPQLPLPVLSAEELRDLHELRMELVHELPESVFRQAALRALGLPLESEWRKVPDSDDDGVFRYNTDFHQIEQITDDGQVVAGTCFWTRAGASESDNYYSGFLAVFPQGITVTDARRDLRAILRIWFWPDELVRVTPNGSKGGLCPPELPAGCALLVERFLLGLGYDY